MSHPYDGIDVKVDFVAGSSFQFRWSAAEEVLGGGPGLVESGVVELGDPSEVPDQRSGGFPGMEWMPVEKDSS